MTTKLVSANLGLILEIERDGKVEKVQFSAVCPSESFKQPVSMIRELILLINETFGTEVYVTSESFKKSASNVEIARSAKIKASKKISQAEFNRKIKELVP